jgi:hypothetical protein
VLAVQDIGSVMRRSKTALAAVAFGAALVTSAAARAQAPVAVVEDVNSKSAGVEFMDYVAAGKVIKLGPSDTLVLSYMSSCARETITGGTVTVGTGQSVVTGGKVDREHPACDAGKIQLTAQQASQSGAVVFRSAPKPGAAQARLTIYGLSPVVEMKGPGHLVVERVDAPGDKIEVDVGAAQLKRGAFFDLASAGKSLAASGTYRASVGGSQLVFKVAPDARPGATPIVGRLLRVQPAT